MKREIKFRGLCHATNQWVYGLLLTETTLSNTISHVAQFADENRKFGRTNVKIIPESVGQYTGLKDKDGKDIYEDDTLDFHLIRLGRSNAKVFFKNGCFFLDVIGQDEDFPLPSLPTRKDIEVKIIGNIHQNPELS